MKKIIILLFLLLFPLSSWASLSFDGVNDYVDAGSNSSLDDLGPLTASAWINAKSSGELTSRILDKSAADITESWIFFQQSGNARALRFFVDGTTDMSVVTNNNVFRYNKWEHVLVTWDGSMTATNVHIYVNGNEVTYLTQTNGASRTFDANNDLVIGNTIDSLRTWNGLIDEVRLYNRALTSNEVKALYRGREVWNGLVGYWPLWGTGNVEQDLSGKKNLGRRLPATSPPTFGRSNPPIPAYAQF